MVWHAWWCWWCVWTGICGLRRREPPCGCAGFLHFDLSLFRTLQVSADSATQSRGDLPPHFVHRGVAGDPTRPRIGIADRERGGRAVGLELVSFHLILIPHAGAEAALCPQSARQFLAPAYVCTRCAKPKASAHSHGSRQDTWTGPPTCGHACRAAHDARTARPHAAGAWTWTGPTRPRPTPLTRTPPPAHTHARSVAPCPARAQADMMS